VKWLKLYVDIAQNPRIKLLAFEDRWHYISLLCAKAEGYLDERPELRDRMVSVHLGLTPSELENVKDRLVDVGLISDSWQIYNWDEKQSKDATGALRKRRERARKKAEQESSGTNKNKNIDIEGKCDSHATVTGQSRDKTPTPTKNPSKAFVVPTIDEIQAYIAEKGYTFSAAKFHAHYESNGWMVGKNKMKKWQAACVTWQANERGRPDDTGPATDAGVIAA
jgi:hypothetical protein